jgi:pentatricopeptide repeat protein
VTVARAVAGRHHRDQPPQVCGHGTKIHGFFLIHRLAPDAHTETALGHGTKIHRLVPDAYTALVDMYAKCGRLDCAQKLLDGFEHRNLATWNLLVAGHTNAGEFDIALEVVETMTRNRLDPNVTTWNGLITGCAM